MSELNKARKADLAVIAKELDIEVQQNFTVANLRALIKSSPHFEENFINSLVKNQIEERNERAKQEELAEKRRVEELEFEKFKLEEKRKTDELEVEKRRIELNLECEKLKVQSQTVSSATADSNNSGTRRDIQKLLPTFNPDYDDIILFMVLLERQLKLSKVPEGLWVSYLLSVVPSSIATLIARESEENASNFSYIKDLLLKRFKLSAGKFRQLFYGHRKAKDSTWRDFYFEIRSYFENWLSELKVNSFDALQDLMLSDLMKRRVSPDCKDHLLDDWESLNSPVELAEKLDAYDNLRPNVENDFSTKKEMPRRDSDYFRKTHQLAPSPIKHTEQTQLSCYGCGKPGFIRKRCPNCSAKSENVKAQQVQLYSCNTSNATAPSIPVTICRKKVFVCADTGASRSIAGERMYKLFKGSGVTFKTNYRDVTLADGITRARKTLSAVVPVEIGGRVFENEFIVLPNAKGNRTLLGMDFLHRAKVVLDAAEKAWYFSDRPQDKYPLVEKYDIRDSVVHVAKIEANPYALREGCDKGLAPEQMNQPDYLLKSREKCFRPGGGGETPHSKFKSPTQKSYKIQRRIYVTNIPYNCEWTLVKELFREKIGDVPFVKIFEHENGKSKGCGIVEFREKSSVLKAIDLLNRYKFRGRQLVVKEYVEHKHGQKHNYGRNSGRVIYSTGDKVWVKSTLMSKRVGPYVIGTQKSSTTYEVADVDYPTESLGTYDITALTPYRDLETVPIVPLRNRGSSREHYAVPSSGRMVGNRGGVCNRRVTLNSPSLVDKAFSPI